MTSSEVAALWSVFKSNPSTALRNQLFEIYRPLLRHHAAKVVHTLPNQVELDDLISAGVFGLMDAIDAFDLNRGVKFESYCIRRIRGAMLDELRAMDWVPRLVRQHARRVHAAVASLMQQLSREPTECELCAELDVTRDELAKMMLDAQIRVSQSLEGDHGNTGRERPIAFISDPRSEDPQQKSLREDWLLTATRGLDQTGRLVVILYYYSNLTMKSIGVVLGLSESRVSQMHTEILARLRSKYHILQELPCR